MPASSAIFAMATPLRCWGESPVRILRVTGTSTADTTACKISATRRSSAKSAEPAAFLQTFLAGQPILMSMISAPSSALSRAASASCWGSLPTICTDRSPPWALWQRRNEDLREVSSLGSAVSISATAIPAPRPTQSSRRGKSVTPAMGARTTGLANCNAPICKPAGAEVPVSVRRCEEARMTFGVGVLATSFYPGAYWGGKAYPAMAKG